MKKGKWQKAKVKKGKKMANGKWQRVKGKKRK
jgi:hypothetical protein